MVNSARLNVTYWFNDPEITFRKNRTSKSLKMFFSKFTILFRIAFDVVAVAVAFFNCKVPSELPGRDDHAPNFRFDSEPKIYIMNSQF